MSDFVRHTDHASCCCTECLFITHCGIPAEDPMWSEVELNGDMRVALYRLAGRVPPIWPKPGPWCGERPWFAILGIELDFNTGAS
jgi:hypothetical protein